MLASESLFHQFRFDPPVLAELMAERNWAGTVTVLLRTGEGTFEARNLFPVGRITEDPATGSAATAVGAYLRELGAVKPGARVTIKQGRHVGRPIELLVDVTESGGIVVTGSASVIDSRAGASCAKPPPMSAGG